MTPPVPVWVCANCGCAFGTEAAQAAADAQAEKLRDLTLGNEELAERVFARDATIAELEERALLLKGKVPHA